MRCFSVPVRATSGATTLLAAVVACGSPLAPEDRLTLVFQSEHFVYHASPGDTVDVTWQEAFHAWVTAALGITQSGPLEYYKYRDAAHLLRATGHGCCGIADNPPSRSFHTINARDNHEMIHVLIGNAWGRAPGLFNEGIVVAYHGNPLPLVFEPSVPYWAGRPIDDIARDRLTANQIPPLDQLLDSESFFGYPNELAYPLAGSFVRYLVNSAGLDAFRHYLAASRIGDSPARTRALFTGVFGTTVDASWAAWLASLQS